MTNDELKHWIKEKLEVIKHKKDDDELCIVWSNWNDDKENTAVWLLYAILAKLEE